MIQLKPRKLSIPKVISKQAIVPRRLETAIHSTDEKISMVRNSNSNPLQKCGFLMAFTVLHFWGITLHTNETERALFSLPYIANAVVLPLEDAEFQERAGAILQIKPEFKSARPGIDELRKDLADKTGLMLFKHPTVVYWLRDNEEISLTANGKISKVDARKRFFGENWWEKEGVEVLDLKGIEYWRFGGQC